MSNIKRTTWMNRTFVGRLIVTLLLVSSIALSVIWPGVGWEYLVAYFASAFAAAPVIFGVRGFAKTWVSKKFQVLFKTLSYSAFVVGLFYALVNLSSGFDPWYAFFLCVMILVTLEALRPISDAYPLGKDLGEKSPPAG